MQTKIILPNPETAMYIETGNQFKTAKIKNISYTDPDDRPALLANFMDISLGSNFSIPLSGVLGEQKKEFDLLQLAREMDESFQGTVRGIEIQISEKFKHASSSVSFEFEWNF